MTPSNSWFRLAGWFLMAASVASCTSSIPAESDGSEGAGGSSGEASTLREAAALSDRFIGTALREPALAGDATYPEVLLREFDSVTPENSMKWGPLAPSPTTYHWTVADGVVAFAEEHGLSIHGHTLVWDEQLPSWVNQNMTSEELSDALRQHIETTLERYRGRIRRWDVVNEAVDIDTESGFTESILWEKLGPEFIRDAFTWAHEADPEALLYYNEVGIERLGPKSDFTYELIRDLVQDGVPIHGIGFQSHVSTHRYPAESNLRENIRRFAELGLRVHISEVDARTQLLPGDRESRLFAQRLAFQQIVGSCVLEPGCEGVTFWGFSDKHSWIVDEVAEEEPLLFDEAYAPKPAYQGALDGFLGRVPALGDNVIENGDFSNGIEGWSVSTGEFVLEPDSEGGACHVGRTSETSSVRREPLLDVLSAGGPYALSARVRLRGGGPALLEASLAVTTGAAPPVDSNLGVVEASDTGWTELAGYFGIGFEGPPDSIVLLFSGAPADVDVCLADVRIRPLTPQ